VILKEDIKVDAAHETFVLNIGPQHPATHGVLRLKVTMDGEYVLRAEPVCGYIHRMQEKMGENRTYAQYLPNTSRVDYLSAMMYTHAFVGAVERAAKIQPPRAEYIRVITSELNRISSHLVWWARSCWTSAVSLRSCTRLMTAKRSWICLKGLPAPA
jgi:NADH-quinone oxidoreductase subunit D